MKKTRITIFAGHYGSGKTNLAVNYALYLRKEIAQVAICDLDIVNPYFRTADSADTLAENGVSLIKSGYADTNVESFSIPSGVQAIFDNDKLYAVVDLGGDDRGALALGQFAQILEKDSYEMLMVVNKYRPLSDEIEKLEIIKDEIEGASGVKFSAIVNNSNLGNQTKLSDIISSLSFAERLSEKFNMPIKMTAIHNKLLKDGALPEKIASLKNLFPIEIYQKAAWKL